MNSFLGTFILFSLLLTGLTACDRTETVSGTGADLLSLKVDSTKPIDISAFNQTLALAGKNGEAWAKDPITIIRRLLNWGRDREAVMAFKGPGEHPRYYKFVVISNRYLDDSVQGERFDIEIEQDESQNWQIKSANKSWRCWNERGHETYSIKPCA